MDNLIGVVKETIVIRGGKMKRNLFINSDATKSGRLSVRGATLKYPIHLKDKTETIILECNKKYIVEVRGYICKGLDIGRYRMELENVYPFVTFYKPQGKKPIVGYYVENLTFVSESCIDNYGIVVLGEYKGIL